MSTDLHSQSPYSKAAPSPQQTVDLFAGRWASEFPAQLNVKAGTAGLFLDPRVPWAVSQLATLGVDIRQSAVVELGPLEGAHTYMLSKAGAKSVTAIEAHPEAFLKCLVAKELLGVERVNFLYGDGCAFLRENPNVYDVGFVSGFLYHMENPLELLRLLGQRCRSIFLWTVHWDAEFSRLNPNVNAGSHGVEEVTLDNHVYRLHRHDYGTGINYGKFWGGPAPHSMWMERDDILEALRRFGFTKQIFETEINPNGAALKLVAAKG